MTLKVISFDLDDTFWPILPVVLRAEKLSNKWLIENYPAIEPLLTREEMYQIRDELISKDSSLSFQLSKLRSLILSEIAKRAGYKERESEQIAEKSFEIFFKARNEVNLYDGVQECLKKIKKIYSLGVITNGNADLKIIGLDHFFDFNISAADAEASKPDQKIFKQAIKISGAEPHEICHVGDHPINDVQGSLEAGMKAIWFNEKRITWPLGGVKEYQEINSWNELEGVLDSIT